MIIWKKKYFFSAFQLKTLRQVGKIVYAWFIYSKETFHRYDVENKKN